MAQEIYHRSEWGNPNEQWGNVYLNADLTNELYKRASEYENSWVTDQLLNGVGTKPSIILTPTAYEDGLLNSVKPKGGENLLLQSNQFDTTWTLSADLNLTSGQSGYDNTNDAWLLKKAAVGKKSCQQFLSLPSSKYTYSAYFKAESTNWVQLWAYNGSVSSNAFFDLENGVVGTTNGSNLNNATIKSVGNGWYRCAITYTSQTTILRIYPAYSDNNTTDGADSGIYIQDAQLERGAEANTYIETTTTAKANASFDFTRGSSATRINELGLVQDVQILSGELVQNGDFEQIGSELVTNGGFDTDSDWNKFNGATISNGKANIIGDGSSFTFIQQTNVFEIGKYYKITADVTINSGLGLKFQDGITSENFGVALTTGSYTFYGVANSTNFTIGRRTGGTAFDSYVDNVSVKEVGQNWSYDNVGGTKGWRVADNRAICDVSGVSNGRNLQQNLDISITSGKKYKISLDILQSDDNISLLIGGQTVTLPTGTNLGYETTFVASSTSTLITFFAGTSDTQEIDNISVVEITDDTDLPRINYKDGEGSLLLENQSTNLVTYSEDFSQWTLSNSSVLSSQVISPDGTQNADKVIASATNTTHSVYIIPSVSATTTYTFSLYAKSGEYQRLYIRQGTGNSPTAAIYDLSGVGAVLETYGSPLDASIELVGNEWYKITLTNTTSSTSPNFAPNITGIPNSGYSADADGVTFLGDGTSGVYIWGAQLEQLSYATSYIPTNGSTVTRLADVCNNSGSSDLINSTEGVLYAEISALANDGNYKAIALSDGTTDNQVLLALGNSDNTITWEIRSNNITSVFTSYSENILQFNKIAIKFKTNDFALWLNGNEVMVDNIGSSPTGMNVLDFQRGDNTLDFYGNVKCVAVFKEALSDTELQKLTTI